MSEQAAKHRDVPPRGKGSPGPRLAVSAPSPRRPRLLAAEPLLELAQRLTRMSDDRLLLTPSDPAGIAIAKVAQMLVGTIEEAADIGTVMDVETAARILGLSVSMVTHLCRKGPSNGGLDAQKLGGEWRISRASVEARLAGRS